jgi:hypothetical protein
MKKFYALRLVDSAYQVEFPFYCMDAESKEEVEQAIDAINHSNLTPEQVSGMLGVILANIDDELFSSEEKTNLFGEITPAEETAPYAIELGENTIPLLYNFIPNAIDGECVEWKYTVAAENSHELEDLKEKLAEAERAMEAAMSFDEAVVPFQNLPLAEDSTTWDQEDARAKLKDWANGDMSKYKRGFVWYDAEKADNYTSYKFPIATIINSKLTAVPGAISAAAGRLAGSKIPAGDKPGVKAHLNKYYKKMGKPYPGESYEDMEFAAGTLDADNIIKEAVAKKTSELESKVDSLNETVSQKDSMIASLQEAAVELKAYKHYSLAREAAELASKLEKPVAKDKLLDDLCALFVTRTDESLKDTIADLKLELDSVDESGSSIKVESITNPLGVVADAGASGSDPIVPDETFTQTLQETIEESEDDVYTVYLQRLNQGRDKKASA